jgi:hypothetical protein
MQHFGRTWSEADINSQAKFDDSVENDPKQSSPQAASPPTVRGSELVALQAREAQLPAAGHPAG